MGWQTLISISLLFLLGLPLGIASPILPERARHLLHHPISTTSAIAQRDFDRGLLLLYGFNYPKALKTFQHATAQDPNCALCFWGIASSQLKLGEDPMDALQQAIALSPRYASPAEQAYIHALAQHPSDAQTMEQVAQQFPDDLDAATLYAEALMDTTPWDYWQSDGQPKPVTETILKTLNAVLERNPNHPGALHFYIHTVEAQHPDWAIAAADRLRGLNLPLSHLVHMPSHIYAQVGRYQDAIASNQDAIALDRAEAQNQSSSPYLNFYTAHNLHFLWHAAMMAGQQTLALETAQTLAATVDPQLVGQDSYGILQHYLVLPLHTFIRFEQWDEILSASAPSPTLRYARGVWHYAQGRAFVAQHQAPQAIQALAQLKAIAADPGLNCVKIWEANPTAAVLQIGVDELAGVLAAEQGQTERAIALLQTAIAQEDRLRYDEPAPWPAPVRQTLGQVLLGLHRPQAAEQVFHTDLDHYPQNARSLNGLNQSQQAQSKVNLN